MLKKSFLTFIGAAILLILLFSAGAWAESGEWDQFQNDFYNSGITNDTAPAETPKLGWLRRVGHGNQGMCAGANHTPVVADGKVFIMGAHADIQAFSAKTGEKLWETGLSCTLNQFQLVTPLYCDGKLFAGTNDGRVYALNAENGSVIWEKRAYTTEYAQLYTPVKYSDGKIYIGSWGTGDNAYYCFDAATGEQVWKRTATSGSGGYYWSGACIAGGYLIFGDQNCYLTCLDKNTGALVDEVDLKKIEAGAGKIHTTASYNPGSHAVYFSDEGGWCWAFAFDQQAGKLTYKWHKKLDMISNSTPAAYNGRVYVGTGTYASAGHFYCLDENSGEELWKFTPAGAGEYSVPGIQASPAISVQNGVVYIYFLSNCENSTVYCLNENGEELWEYRGFEAGTLEGHSTSSVAVADGWLYFGNDGGWVYALTFPDATLGPDLTVTDLEVGNLHSGETAAINAVVKNQGEQAAGSFAVSLYAGEELIDTQTVTSLVYGEDATISYIWTPPVELSGKEITLKLVVDSANGATEIIETNNEKDVTVKVKTDETEISVSPAEKKVDAGESFTVDVLVDAGLPVAGCQFDLGFNPAVLEVVSVSEGNFLTQNGAATFFQPGIIDNAAGKVSGVAGAIITPGQDVSGAGIFASISLKSLAAGASDLNLANVIAGNKDGQGIELKVNNGKVTVQNPGGSGGGGGSGEITVHLEVQDKYGEKRFDNDITVDEGSSVYDVLLQASKQDSQMKPRLDPDNPYVFGGYIWSMYGQDSLWAEQSDGWIYYVNGDMPGIGATKKTVEDSDEVFWAWGDMNGPKPVDKEEVSVGAAAGGNSVAGAITLQDIKNAVSSGLKQFLTVIDGKIAIEEEALEKASEVGMDLVCEVKDENLVLTFQPGALKAEGELELRVRTLGEEESASWTGKLSENLLALGKLFEITAVQKEDGGEKPVTWEKGILLTFSYRNLTVTDEQNLSVYFYDEKTGSWDEIPAGVVDTDKKEVKVSVPHLSKYLLVEKLTDQEILREKIEFSDLPDTHWAKEVINYMVSQGLITGYPDGTCRPDDAVTRAEFAALLVRVLKIQAVEGKVFFDDVPAGKWYAGSVAAAFENGFIKGYSENKFLPEEKITRQEVAVMLRQALAFRGMSVSVEDTDTGKQLELYRDSADISPWARESLAVAARQGLISGFPDGAVLPGAAATRAQCAAMLKKLLD